MKVSVLGGAGTLGATSAFVIAQQNLVDEICLIDINENVVKSHEMDMGQAAFDFSKTKITCGDFSKLAGSDIIINTVGIPEKKVSSRMEYLEGNYKIIQQISKPINEHTRNPIIITGTNPLDIINSLLQYTLDTDKSRIIGFSLNDTFRFRWALSKVLNVPFEKIDAIVIGEHGEDQLPIYSRIFVNDDHVILTEDQKAEVKSLISNWFSEYQSLNSGRTTGWLSSINIAKIVKAIVKDTKAVFPCSAIDEDMVSIGQLVCLGRNGIESVQKIDMTKAEEQEFIRIKEKIKNQVSDLRGQGAPK